MSSTHSSFKGSSILGAILGIAVIVGIWATSEKIDWAFVQANVSWPLLCVSLLVHNGLLLVTAMQIGVYISRFSKVSSWVLAQKFFASQCTTVFLPSTLGEMLIVPFLSQHAISPKISAGAYLFSKLINTVLLLSVAFAFLLFLDSYSSQLVLIVVAVCAIAAPILLLFITPLRVWVRARIEKLSPQFADGVGYLSLFVRKHPLAAVQVFLLGGLKHLCTFTFTWLVLYALGGQTPLWVIAGATSIGTLAGLFSITPRNIGVFEGALAYFTKGFGDSAQLVLFAMLIVRLIGSLDIFISYAVTTARYRKKLLTQ